MSRDELIGALNLGATTPDLFTTEFVDIAREIADQIAVAVKQAQLSEREAQRRREAEALRDTAAALKSTLNLDEVLDRILDNVGQNSNRPLNEILNFIIAQASRLLETKSGAIFRLEVDEQMFSVQEARGLPSEFVTDLTLPIDGSFLGRAVLNRQPVVVSDLQSAFLNEDNALDPQRRKLVVDHYQTLLAVPLIRQGRTEHADEIYGGIVLYYPEVRQFSNDQIDLVLAFGDQAALAIENARLHQRAEQAAVMEERGRLARELHDSLTQSLYSLTLFAEAGQRLIKAEDLQRVTHYLGRLGETAQQALKEMRLLVYELRPLALDQAGLVGALQQRLDTVEKRSGVETRLLVNEEVELASSVEEDLYRIAQEALNNILKHAMATVVTVQITANSERIELEVTDNGRGFEPDTVSDGGGMGLISMQERTEKLGGSLQISSRPGEGTSVKLQLSQDLP
jgi:signal transduction histidine kinase